MLCASKIALTSQKISHWKFILIAKMWFANPNSTSALADDFCCDRATEVFRKRLHLSADIASGTVDIDDSKPLRVQVTKIL